MYLSTLDLEKKHIFLDLEIYMAQIDGDFSDREKEIINAHCYEMRIDNNNFECEKSLDEVYSKIKEIMTEKEKRIIFLELVATILADDTYHMKETEMTESLSSLLGISESDKNEAFAIIQDIKRAYERCDAYIA